MATEEHFIGHRERLRRRFLQSGLDGMHDYEALELLLTFAIPRRDVKPLAKKLLHRFGSFAAIFDATENELRAEQDVGENTAALFLTIKAMCAAYLSEKMKQTELLNNPEAVIDYARIRIGGLKTEAFMVIYLTAQNRVIDAEMLHHGTVDHAAVYPRNIIQHAVLKNAVAIIIIHNHPSGCCEPSREDIGVTEKIRHAAETVGLRLVDHLIVGRTGYVSFVERGIL